MIYTGKTYKKGQVVTFMLWCRSSICLETRIGKIVRIKHRNTENKKTNRVEYFVRTNEIDAWGKNKNICYTVCDYHIKKLLILETLKQAK
jgi:hypothetical protein